MTIDHRAGPRPHAAVVYNPLKTNLVQLRAVVERYERQAGWARTQWYETEEQDAGIARTRLAVSDGARVVLACGGDGTMRAVAEALRRTKVPMAVVPQGTGNLLARNIGLNVSDIDAAVRAAFLGEDHAIDLGVATIFREDDSQSDHVFLVLAGMGLDARAIQTTRSSLKKAVGWLAYIDAGIRSLIQDRPLKIHYSTNGTPAKSLEVYSVMIGNCGVLPGGVLLIPDAVVDDGLFDVVALRPLGPFSWLRIWNKIGWENGVLRKTKAGRKIIDLVNDTKSVTYVQAHSYAASVDTPEPIQLDGDDFGLAVAVKGMVDPGSLILRVLPTWRDVGIFSQKTDKLSQTIG